MRAMLVGADFEENLGLGILAAVLEQHDHTAYIVPFNVPGDAGPIVQRAIAEQPDLIGLSIQFQHRGHEFLGLAKALRRAGYRGHITAGAQFPTLAYREVLEGDHGVSSVVMHDGDETIVDLAKAVENGTPMHEVDGLALLGNDGVAYRTGERRMPDDLDRFPFAKRYRPHNKHIGVPFVPLIGGRGCWSKCSYCSIVAFYRDGREHGGGRLFRVRSPENVAQEMALLWHKAGGPCIFCFHDDNFTLPNPDRTIERVQAIRDSLDDYGVGMIGIVGKARPDTITPDLAKKLAALGVIRLYVGVENASQDGGDHLRRGTQQKHVREALTSCREAGIFNCYNLLMFEPGATLEHLHQNADFIRDHAGHPVNFCRAEPYHGTPLHLEMARNQDLGGSYLGWNYRIGDDRAELAFRVCSAAFRERNFAPRGVANRYMGLGYAGNVLRRFYAGPRAEALRDRANRLTRSISLDTAEHLYRALELAETADLGQPERFERLTARLALDVAAQDRVWHEALDEIYTEMHALADEPRVKKPIEPTAKLMKLAKSLGIGASILAAATAASGCECSESHTRDGGMDGGFVVDPPPHDAGRVADAGMDGGFVVDPPPPDAGRDAGFVVDPPPPDAGRDAGRDSGFVVDPPPADMDGKMSLLHLEEQEEAEDDAAFLADGRLKKRLRLIDQWRDSGPSLSVRTTDLPLADPPAPELRATREGDLVRVTITNVHVPFRTRWQCDGIVHGDGAEVAWTPKSEHDQLRVAVRSRGGVAVVSLRASAV
jgi:anaerobic magnesium-protoporphyrin IX monomethyl ester cyclase